MTYQKVLLITEILQSASGRSPIFVGDFYAYLTDLITLLFILSCINLGKYTPTKQPEIWVLKKKKRKQKSRKFRFHIFHLFQDHHAFALCALMYCIAYQSSPVCIPECLRRAPVMSPEKDPLFHKSVPVCKGNKQYTIWPVVLSCSLMLFIVDYFKSVMTICIICQIHLAKSICPACFKNIKVFMSHECSWVSFSRKEKIKNRIIDMAHMDVTFIENSVWYILPLCWKRNYLFKWVCQSKIFNEQQMQWYVIAE